MKWNKSKLEAEVARLKPWFHSIDLPYGVKTNTSHDNPKPMWDHIKPMLSDVSGKTIIDIGSNAGYIGIQLEKAGAIVDAADKDPLALAQLALVKDVLKLKMDVRFADINSGEGLLGQTYDIALLLGVIYHSESPIISLRIAFDIAVDEVIIESAINDSKDGVCDCNFNYQEHEYKGMFIPSITALRNMIAYCGGAVIGESTYQKGRIVMRVIPPSLTNAIKPNPNIKTPQQASLLDSPDVILL